MKCDTIFTMLRYSARLTRLRKERGYRDLVATVGANRAWIRNILAEFLAQDTAWVQYTTLWAKYDEITFFNCTNLTQMPRRTNDLPGTIVHGNFLYDFTNWITDWLMNDCFILNSDNLKLSNSQYFLLRRPRVEVGPDQTRGPVTRRLRPESLRDQGQIRAGEDQLEPEGRSWTDYSGPENRNLHF